MHTAQAASGHTQGKAEAGPETTPGVLLTADFAPISISPSDALVLQTDERLSKEQIDSIENTVREWRTQARRGDGNPLLIHSGFKLVAVMQMPQDDVIGCVIETPLVAP